MDCTGSELDGFAICNVLAGAADLSLALHERRGWVLMLSPSSAPPPPSLLIDLPLFTPILL